MVSSSHPAVLSLRPFVPARDFARSQAFYQALGFSVRLAAADMAVVTTADGAAGFLLQDFYEPALAENFMLQLQVIDLDNWWQHVQTLNLPTTFDVPAPVAPTLMPWGLRVMFLHDPAGVLWHITARFAPVAPAP